MFTDYGKAPVSNKLDINHFVNKTNLKNVLMEMKFCGFCLEKDNILVYLNEDPSSVNTLASNLVPMVKETLGDELLKDSPSKYICSICKDKVVHAYTFVNKVKNSYNLLKKYVDEIQIHASEVGDILNTTGDNLANTVIVLQEHEYDDNNTDNIEQDNSLCVKIGNYGEKSDYCNLYPEIVIGDDVSIDNSKDCDDFESSDDVSIDDSKDCDDFESSDDVSIDDSKDCEDFESSDKSLKYDVRKVHKGKISKPDAKVKCNQCRSVPCIHERYLSSYKKQRDNHNPETELVLKCIDCDYVCKNKSSLLTHANRIHLKIRPFLCEKCGQSFHSRDNHFLHMKNIHSDGKVCHYCGEKFSMTQELCDHMDICRNEDRTHKCDSCIASFKTTKQLELHKEDHNNSLSCNVCFKTFVNATTFKKHCAKAHTTQKDYYNVSTINNIKPRPRRVCSICAAEFSKLSELKLHVKYHNPGEKHTCFTCNEQFETYKLYRKHKSYPKHLRKVNPDIRLSFTCQNCEFTCKVSRDLEHHRNVKHLKITPYGCENCSKKFTTKYHLKAHEQTHTSVRKYMCKECNHSFTTTTGLRKHMYRLHLTDKTKPYACEFCDRGFVYQSEYDLHKLRKHSERSVRCPLCEAKFHSIANVRRHIISVHAKLIKVTELMEFEKSQELNEIFRDRRLTKMDT